MMSTLKYKIRVALFGFLLLVFSLTKAQVNLVPNPGFEVYDTCPQFVAEITKAKYWYSTNGSSPDYFNQCSGVSDVSVPQNAFGNQNAFQGQAYVGITIYEFWDFREYISVQLNQQLQVGTKYFLSFYASFADSVRLGSDKLGALLTTALVYQNNNTSLLAKPQVQNPNLNYLSGKSG